MFYVYLLRIGENKGLKHYGTVMKECNIRMGLTSLLFCKLSERKKSRKSRKCSTALTPTLSGWGGLVRGFTLTELLVSITIFVILATVVLANFRTGGYSDDLRATADELVANIRRVQNLAVAGALVHYDASGKDIKIGEIPPTADSIPPGGYGISVLWYGDEYTAFADFATCTDDDPNKCNNDDDLKCVYYPTPEKIDFRYDQYCDQTIESATVRFRPKVGISTIIPYGDLCEKVGLSPIDITFQAPQPVPRLNGENNSIIKIELRHKVTNQCRMITVDTATGMVSQELESHCESGFQSCP